MLFRLAYLGVVNVFAVLRVLPGSDRDKDTEILALRHQFAVVRRQLGGQKIRFPPPTGRCWPRSTCSAESRSHVRSRRQPTLTPSLRTGGRSANRG